MPMRRGKRGKARLLSGSNKSFGFELGLELEKSLKQPTCARAADGLGTQLEFAPRFIQRGQGAQFDVIAIGRGEVGELVAAAKHHAAYLRIGVLRAKNTSALMRRG